MNEEVKNNQPHLTKSKATYFYLILLLTSLLFAFLTGFFAKKTVRLQNQLKECADLCNTKTDSTLKQDTNAQVPENVDRATPKPRNPQPDYSNEKINNGGPITNAISLSTEKWISYSSKLNNGVSFSYKYPENLYVVPSSNDYFSILDFFENKEASERYFSCVNDPVPEPGSPTPRNHEGACSLKGDLLFSLIVGKYEDGNDLSNLRPSEIIEYSSSYGNISWRLPKGGASQEIYGNIFIVSKGVSMLQSGDGINGYTVQMTHPYMQSDKDKIINLTNLDHFNLLIHILSTFKTEK